MNRRTLLAGLALLPAIACAQTDTSKPQPPLPTEPLTVVTGDGQKHVFNVEMAMTPQQQEVGLMWRPTVAPDGGMLFDWGGERESDMWMKNTISSLDMLFVASNGTITHIAENCTPRSLAVISSGGPVRATIELAAGTAARLHIKVGDKVLGGPFGKA
jgi:uncharacterized membrane protein (UPF0127 family)